MIPCWGQTLSTHRWRNPPQPLSEVTSDKRQQYLCSISALRLQRQTAWVQNSLCAAYGDSSKWLKLMVLPCLHLKGHNTTYWLGCSEDYTSKHTHRVLRVMPGTHRHHTRLWPKTIFTWKGAVALHGNKLAEPPHPENAAESIPCEGMGSGGYTPLWNLRMWVLTSGCLALGTSSTTSKLTVV